MSEILPIDELRLAIREVVDDRFGDTLHIPGEEGRGLDREFWAEMASLGWLALPVAEEHGGLGLGLAHLAALYEELGRHVTSVPVAPTMLAAQVIAEADNADLKSRWLPAIAAGECLAALALPEHRQLPTCGADGTVSGVVEHVLFADVANLLLVPVSLADGALAFALVEPGQAGVSVVARPVVDLTRSMADIRLDAVSVDAARIVRVSDAQVTALLDHAAIALAADAIGGIDALFDRTVEYLTIREQFGRPIGSFQALKHRMANWKVELAAVRMLVRHSAAVVAGKDARASEAASGAKAYACDTYAAFAADAIQLHGGIGFTWEHPCHLFLKRAKLSQQLFGGAKQHKDRVATLAFG